MNRIMRVSQRPLWAWLFLLGMVLTVTFQLISGFAFAMGVTAALSWHIAEGLAGSLFLLGEWTWLLGTKLGRVHLRRIFLLTETYRDSIRRQLQGSDDAPLRDGLNAALEGWFLVAATVTVIFGIALWRGCGICLMGHRILAWILALLWLVHLALSVWDHWPSRSNKPRRTS
jgi:hypothetical protein